MNKKQILQKVRKLIELYNNDQVVKLQKHEVHPTLGKSSRENYLYFTLPVCINFQRSSPAMWQSAIDTWNDSKTNYLFYPEKVIKKKEQTIKSDLIKYNLALQRNKHAQIWIKICNTLYSHFDSDPRKILKINRLDAKQILQFVQVDKKELFPYLGGKKLSNYWLFILNLFTDIKLKNLNHISIIPDTHIIQSSIKLGLVGNNTTPEAVESAWHNLLLDTDINSLELHPILWNWSRNNFRPFV